MDSVIADSFAHDASLLPHFLDLPSDQVMLSRLSAADYRLASFLDQRIITPQLPRQLVDWADLLAIPLDSCGPAHFIFHIGHVGSTLIARLLGELPKLLVLREPQILRDLTEISALDGNMRCPWAPATIALRRNAVLTWLSRSFAHDQRALVKASSFVSQIASDLVRPEAKALLLFVPLERYMPTILAGDASVRETHMLAGARLARLQSHLEEPIANLWELDLGQRVALNWLCEMQSLKTLADQTSAVQIMWCNFDDFLAAPAMQLCTIANHFDVALSADHAENLVNGPIMHRYAKAPEHDYSPQLRRELLTEATAAHGPTIAAARNWVTALANRHKPIANLLDFAHQL
ncbi:MAG: hypothetical protein U5J78_07185 [Parasphingorhabdus sp.]|nr:hypothetical protein [Parasphingorhabdus sp.]